MMFMVPIAQVGNEDLAAAGGKGMNLGALARAGFPVPAGFVLTTPAYERFVKENDLQERIMGLARKVGDRQATDRASSEIKQLFMDGIVADGVVDELSGAYAELGEIAVAVRSSATAEDLPEASFAGQHETFLNVRGREALLRAVKACWASLWSAQAMAYRVRMGVGHEGVAMAVVVQKMVPAEVSGILFTANPTTGARDELVVEASFGLGEAVVSGQVTPDSFILDRNNGRVKQAQVGAKEVMIVSGREQRTVTRKVPKALRNQPIFNQAQLVKLGGLGTQVEEYFGGTPQDIEWALAEDRFWILQARPISNLPPEPLRDVRWEPIRPGSVWMRRQVVEHLPEPLSPLFDELYVREGLDQSMQALVDFMSELSGMEIKLWEIIPPPFATTYNGYAYSIASFEINRRLIPFVLRIYVVVLPKMIRHLVPRWREESLPAYRAAAARWKRVDLDTATDEDLLRGIRELAYEDAVYWFASAVALGLARITDSALDAFLKLVAARQKWAQERRPTSAAYLRGFSSKAVEAQIELEAVAREINKSSDLRDEVLSTSAAELRRIIENHTQGEEALAGLERYLETYGHQIYNLDFAVPTLADDPLPVLLSLQTAVAHPEQDARAKQKALARERDALAAQTARSLSPVLRPLFRRLLNWAQRYAPYREEALFYVGAAWPALRRLALELGRRLSEVGTLAEADDVFYLESAELLAASSARAAGRARPELGRAAEERRTLREARKRLHPPLVVPPDGRMKFGPIDMAMFEPKPRKAGSGPTLEGFGISPGQVTAPASVIRTVEDFEQMAPDTILVCTTTTPAWTPLFAQAKGLVTDIGGALAHGSIVAREYGIPAVMGTGEATQRISSGQMISVDGSSGRVTLVDEIGREAAPMEPAESGRATKSWAAAALAAGLAAGLLLWWKKGR